MTLYFPYCSIFSQSYQLDISLRGCPPATCVKGRHLTTLPSVYFHITSCLTLNFLLYLSFFPFPFLLYIYIYGEIFIGRVRDAIPSMVETIETTEKGLT